MFSCSFPLIMIRYMFKSAERAALQEIGPRFTLKLKYIKKGIPAVHQFGAAPPPLVFDDDDDGEDEEAAAAKSVDDGAATNAAVNDASVEPPAPATGPAAPGKDEEYIWQWKVRLVPTAFNCNNGCLCAYSDPPRFSLNSKYLGRHFFCRCCRTSVCYGARRAFPAPSVDSSRMSLWYLTTPTAGLSKVCLHACPHALLHITLYYVSCRSLVVLNTMRLMGLAAQQEADFFRRSWPMREFESDDRRRSP